MNQKFYSLKDAAAILHRQPYQIVYALTTGKVDEPQRIGGKRIFTSDDLQRLADRLGVENFDCKRAQKGAPDAQ